MSAQSNNYFTILDSINQLKCFLSQCLGGSNVSAMVDLKFMQEVGISMINSDTRGESIVRMYN